MSCGFHVAVFGACGWSEQMTEKQEKYMTAQNMKFKCNDKAKRAAEKTREWDRWVMGSKYLVKAPLRLRIDILSKGSTVSTKF